MSRPGRRGRRWSGGGGGGRERWCRPLRLLAVGPRAGLAVGSRLEHVAPLTRRTCGVLGREIDEHRGEDRVDLHVVETDLVVRVAVRVPGVAAVVPVAR